MGRCKLGLATPLLVCPLAGPPRAAPNCKEAVANQDGKAARLADGYSWSILLMMAMPFTLLGTGTVLVSRAGKRGQFPEF